METPPSPPRITMRSIFEGILDIFNLEHGLIYTSIALTLKPGIAIRTYLYEDRTRLVKPFRFLLLTIALATFATIQYFKYSLAGEEISAGFFDGLQQGTESAAANPGASQLRTEALAKQITDITKNYINLFLLAGVPIVSLATSWVFRRKMNYAEHLVLNSYITGYMTMGYLVLMPLLFFLNFVTFTQLYSLFLLIYSSWAYSQAFREKIGVGIAKSLLATLIYLVLYYVVIIVLLIGMVFFNT
ncbi:MAG: DUF3667 domain-containing protein [Saprospiraceae bacterium]|nr:DUF3667 domain-containing protein [Saprospiraceae bacterium]